ncbi:hypothetical protein PG989_015067 [Apiospora arundinis]
MASLSDALPSRVKSEQRETQIETIRAHISQPSQATSNRKRPRNPENDLDQSNKRREIVNTSPNITGDFSSSQPNDHPAHFEYNGSKFTLFRPWEYEYLDALLFSQKHSTSRLEEARFFQPQKPHPEIKYKKEEFSTMPLRDSSHEKLRHVLINCSVVGCASSRREVSQITVLNLADGKELINSYVWPKAPVTHWDIDEFDTTITQEDLIQASVEGGVLLGWEAARRKLAQFVDSETIFVGTRLRVALNALRISHKHIFELAIARKDSAFNTQALQKSHYAQHSNSANKLAEPGADGRFDYYHRALDQREMVITCLRKPWLACCLGL